MAHLTKQERYKIENFLIADFPPHQNLSGSLYGLPFLLPFRPEIHLKTVLSDATIGAEIARRFLKTPVSLTFHDSEGDLPRSIFEVNRQREFAKITAYHLRHDGEISPFLNVYFKITLEFFCVAVYFRIHNVITYHRGDHDKNFDETRKQRRFSDRASYP